MGFAKFGAVGGAGGAELTVWLRLRDEMTKALVPAQKALTQFQKFQTTAARDVLKSTKQFAEAETTAGRKAATTKMQQAQSGVNAMQRYIGMTHQQIDAVNLQKQSHLGLAGVSALSIMDWKKGREAGLRYNTMGGRVADRVRGMTHGMRGFRMEMLGVMFFGMQLNKWMMGLLQPALQLTGIFDMFTATLEALFLPIAMMLMDFLMPIFNWLMDLPEPVKKFIGIMVVLGAVFGALIMLTGQFALGIGSMIVAFGGLIGLLPSLPALVPMIIGMVGVFASLIGVVTTVGDETEKTGGVMAGMLGSLGGAFEWFSNFVGGIFGSISKVIPESFKFIFDAIQSLFSGFVGIFTGDIGKFVGKITDAIAMVMQGMLPLVINGINSILDWLEGIPFIGDIIYVIRRIFTIIVGAIVGNWEDVQDAIDQIIRKIQKWAEWGSYIVCHLWGAIVTFLESIPVVGDVVAFIGRVWKAFTGATAEIALIGIDFVKIIVGAITGNWEMVQDGIENVIHRITKWAEWGIYMGQKMIGGLIKGFGEGIGGAMAELFGKTAETWGRRAGVAWTGISEFFGGIGGWFGEVLGMQHGGIVTRPRLAMIGERGPEAVIPLTGAGAGAGGNIIYFNPDITINIETATEVDIDAIKEKLSTEWVSELKGMLEG